MKTACVSRFLVIQSGMKWKMLLEWWSWWRLVSFKKCLTLAQNLTFLQQFHTYREIHNYAKFHKFCVFLNQNISHKVFSLVFILPLISHALLVCKKCNSLYRSFEERDGENFKRLCSHTSHHAIPTEPTLPNSTSTHYHHNSHVSFFFSLFNSILFLLLGWFCLCSECSRSYIRLCLYIPLPTTGSCSVRNTLKNFIFSLNLPFSLYVLLTKNPTKLQPTQRKHSSSAKQSKSIHPLVLPTSQRPGLAKYKI